MGHRTSAKYHVTRAIQSVRGKWRWVSLHVSSCFLLGSTVVAHVVVSFTADETLKYSKSSYVSSFSSSLIMDKILAVILIWYSWNIIFEMCNVEMREDGMEGCQGLELNPVIWIIRTFISDHHSVAPMCWTHCCNLFSLVDACTLDLRSLLCLLRRWWLRLLLPYVPKWGGVVLSPADLEESQ